LGFTMESLHKEQTSIASWIWVYFSRWLFVTMCADGKRWKSDDWRVGQLFPYQSLILRTICTVPYKLTIFSPCIPAHFVGSVSTCSTVEINLNTCVPAYISGTVSTCSTVEFPPCKPVQVAQIHAASTNLAVYPRTNGSSPQSCTNLRSTKVQQLQGSKLHAKHDRRASFERDISHVCQILIT
jgi:hypothetical protein